MLPNNVLLEIFDLYLIMGWIGNTWHRLVHVCQKWRNIVFRSPCRLNLQIFCTDERPVRRTLDVWPPLLIKICYYGFQKSTGFLKYKFGDDVDNIIAALEHNDRVCEMTLFNAPGLEMEKVLKAMQEPFPALTELKLRPVIGLGAASVIHVPDSFLGGSGPRLRTLSLEGIPVPFPGLQKLLLSATDLVHLQLRKISDSVYFAPEAIVTCLSALTRLEQLELTFLSPRSRPDRESQRPPIRILLPAITQLTFQGVSEYLEDLVAQIDAPKLQALSITFFHQLFFHNPQLARFISRAPSLKGHDEVRVVFEDNNIRITFLFPSRPHSREQEIRLGISCVHPDLQLSSLAQVCTSSFPQTFIPTVKHLYILESRQYPRPHWENNMIQNRQWLDLLHPFTTVKNLYLSEKILPHIAPALQELVGERVTAALPALQCLFLDGLRTSGPVQETIMPFVDARQLSTHPIVASYWDWEEDEWWEGDD